ncbi:N-acetylmuramoyl-L-alanine amidase [Gorillibacterium sp. sgz5001074]|uniref:N-acetylmuramoyl-L-alanine amidase n=1 Tax=Gorillibacterium sp. sgz5001074 TaxID=3446695 RepID=UPI003F66BD06
MRSTAKNILSGLLAAILLAAEPAGAYAATKVVLDPGHGGSDPGAIGVNGLQEKDVNLDIALKLREELVKRGYEVIMTRETDAGLTLAQRVEFTDRIMPSLFVSVHANSYKDSRTRGSMVLYYDKDYPQSDYPASDAMTALTPESKKLAQALQDNMVNRAGTVDKGLVPSAVYVARMGSVPSALVETAFLSNPSDAALLADDGFRSSVALGLAEGISEYLPAERTEPGAYPDVPLRHWANPAIQELKDKGIVKGENGRFYPDRPLKRAEFVVMLDRMFRLDLSGGAACNGSASGGSSVTGSTYGGGTSVCTPASAVRPSDLPSSYWASSIMTGALNRKVLEGYPDGTVRPEGTLTRGEAAAVIDRIIYPGSSQKAGTPVFRDVPSGLWSAAAINRLKSKGIISGDTADTFAPERPITRAEMSMLLSRMLH